MEKLPDEAGRVLGMAKSATKHTVRFVSDNFGLRRRNAPKLPSDELRRLRRSLNAIVTASLIGLAVVAWLVYRADGKLVVMLQGAQPLSDLEEFLASLWTHRLGSYSVAGVGFVLVLWLLVLVRRLHLQPIFLLIPLTLISAGACFNSVAEWKFTSRVRRLFDRGCEIAPLDSGRLLDDEKHEEAHTYFASVWPLTQRTFIGDNVLGRRGGASYALGRYEDAIKDYAQVLRDYPETDIKANVRQSLRMAMRDFGEESDAAQIIELYEGQELRTLQFSPFEFVLNAPKDPSSVPFERFNSAAHLKRVTLQSLLARYPDDALVPLAAFLVGDRELLATRFPGTPYGTSSLVIEAMDAVQLQQFETAIEKFSAYLQRCPTGEASDDVRVRLAQCYLEDDDLETAFDRIAALSSRPFHLRKVLHTTVLRRYAFEPSDEVCHQVFEKYASTIPTRLAIDLCEILAERYELAGDTVKGAALRHRSRVVLAGTIPQDMKKVRVDRVGTLLQSQLLFQPHADLVRFVNSRLLRTENDKTFKHVLDRNYWHPRDFASGVAAPLYTERLKSYADRHARTLVEAAPPGVERLRTAVAMWAAIEEPAWLEPLILEQLQEVTNSEAPPSYECVPLLQLLRAERTLQKPCLQAALRIVKERGAAMATEGDPNAALKAAFNVVEEFPSTETATELTGALAAWAADGTADGAAVFSVASDLEALLRASRRSQRTEACLVECLYRLYKTADIADDSLPTRRALRGVAIYCLRRPGLYDHARTYFSDYCATYPADPFQENCRAWLAWLDCFDAWESRTVEHAWLSAIRGAKSQSDWIVKQGRQPLMVLRARSLSHRLRTLEQQVPAGRFDMADLTPAADFTERGFVLSHRSDDTPSPQAPETQEGPETADEEFGDPFEEPDPLDPLEAPSKPLDEDLLEGLNLIRPIAFPPLKSGQGSMGIRSDRNWQRADKSQRLTPAQRSAISTKPFTRTPLDKPHTEPDPIPPILPAPQPPGE